MYAHMLYTHSGSNRPLVAWYTAFCRASLLMRSCWTDVNFSCGNGLSLPSLAAPDPLQKERSSLKDDLVASGVFQQERSQLKDNQVMHAPGQLSSGRFQLLAK